MEHTDEHILAMDPQKFTIAKLKSVLSARGVELPVDKQKREQYVQIFTDYQDTIRKSKKRKSDAENVAGTPISSKKTKTAVPLSSTKKTNPASTPSTSSKRKSNIFQQLPSPGGDIIEEAQDNTTKKIRLPAPSFDSVSTPDTLVLTDSAPTQASSEDYPSTPSTLPFSILQDTISSSTPYNAYSATPSSSQSIDDTPFSVNSNQSAYNTPYAAKKNKHSNTERTPASQDSDSEQPYSNAGRTPFGKSANREEPNITHAGRTPYDNTRRQSGLGRNREYEEERRQREQERQKILQEQERQRKEKIDAKAEQDKKKVWSVLRLRTADNHLSRS